MKNRLGVSSCGAVDGKWASIDSHLGLSLAGSLGLGSGTLEGLVVGGASSRGVVLLVCLHHPRLWSDAWLGDAGLKWNPSSVAGHL